MGDGDHTTVGDIINAQGVAVGTNASARVTGNNIPGDVKIDATELRSALEDLFDALNQTGLPKDKTRSVQTAAGNALDAVNEGEIKADVVVQHVKKIGETLKEAKVVVQEGTSLWESVKKLAPLVGPLVGGARIVAGWFGVPL
jgi:methyl-accepting chemotaxis protein